MTQQESIDRRSNSTLPCSPGVSTSIKVQLAKMRRLAPTCGYDEFQKDFVYLCGLLGNPMPDKEKIRKARAVFKDNAIATKQGRFI